METTLIPTQAANQANIHEDIFYRQKAYFDSNITKSFEWCLDQLDRLAQMLSEHTNEFYDALSRDFKTALSEKVFEVAATVGTVEVTKGLLKSWMQPIEAPVPKFLAESGHKAIVYREPYGVTLIMGPFNGPLLRMCRMRRRNLCGERLHGAASGALRQGTPMSTRMWQMSLLRNAAKP